MRSRMPNFGLPSFSIEKTSRQPAGQLRHRGHLRVLHHPGSHPGRSRLLGAGLAPVLGRVLRDEAGRRGADLLRVPGGHAAVQLAGLHPQDHQVAKILPMSLLTIPTGPGKSFLISNLT